MSGGENVFLTITQNQEAIILKGLLSSTNFFPKSICMENKQSQRQMTQEKNICSLYQRESQREETRNIPK